MNLDHLRRLTTSKGVFEHCLGTAPRIEHGYCTDDVSRALVAVARHPGDLPEQHSMAATYLDYLIAAYRGDGRFASRRDVGGRWADEAFAVDGSDEAADSTGRAIWSLGTAATRLADPEHRTLARHLFDEACRFRSVWPRATAFSVLGAGAITAADPTHVGASRLLADAADVALPAVDDDGWPWPEPRLTYANAVLAEMLIVLGRELRINSLVTEGLRLLRWLADLQTAPGGWLSLTPSVGWQPGEPQPGFDQQPIEAATLADAAAAAWMHTGDPQWAVVLRRCGDWFDGHNDLGVTMADRRTGAGFDGLTPSGRNLNCGAESTIAAITTLQWAAMVA